ncbi:hypothetical protein [Chryseobacterium sp. FH1]|uniref:hypothetical protein n=1 Tax=Chryseobacterium sp. FH1 TaxID=1233951 RepID=UPI0004E37039|nr:hypothetical protein [Chryseobacterium sp. FH1]KFC19457.1 hypothetical protein IO90_09175 [Chryseobacterium sp. FH1]
MAKLIFKYWLINALFCIALFIFHRVLISEKAYADDDWIEFIINILDILMNLGFSLIFLVVFPLGALTFFLNLIKQIKSRYYLSLLTFVAVPVGVSIYVLIAVIDFASSGRSLLTTVLILSIIYLIFNYFQFRLFRQRVALMDEVVVETT